MDCCLAAWPKAKCSAGGGLPQHHESSLSQESFRSRIPTLTSNVGVGCQAGFPTREPPQPLPCQHNRHVRCNQVGGKRGARVKQQQQPLTRLPADHQTSTCAGRCRAAHQEHSTAHAETTCSRGSPATARAFLLDTAIADQRNREGAVRMTVAMLPLAPTDAKNS